MKKLMVFGISLFILLFSLVSASVRVNEVMADPDRCPDSHCEYIEIYTDTPIELTDWVINDTRKQITFDFSLEDYLIITANKESFIGNFSVNESKVIEWSVMSLHNSNDSVFLFNNNSELIDNFTYDDTTAGISWQFCQDSWIESEPTPGSENNCTIQGDCIPDCTNKDCGDDGCGGSCGSCESGETCENNECKENTEIYLEINWDEDKIINGEEFEIEIKAYNLGDDEYYIKVYITKEDDDTIISDRYDKNDDEWKSGTYRVYSFFEGSGNDAEDITLKIRSSYDDFKGDAELHIRLEGENEIIKEIKILEKEEDGEEEEDEDEEEENPAEEPKKSAPVTGGVIRLGNRNNEEENEEDEENKEAGEGEWEEGNVLYESGNEKIKKYAIYALNLILIVIIIFLFKMSSSKK